MDTEVEVKLVQLPRQDATKKHKYMSLCNMAALVVGAEFILKAISPTRIDMRACSFVLTNDLFIQLFTLVPISRLYHLY